MSASVPPRATYRLQFSRHFTFRDAARLIPYLDALGVSHVYASPYLKARAGSNHGYDITDYNTLNPEIGDPDDFEAFVAALARHGMGQILDIVPNHTGVGRADNAWWLDVLEWGRGSIYADFFDIGWNTPKPTLRGKVLLPVLGDHYGAVLEDGALVPRFDREAGSFSVWYHEHRFPLAPATYAGILRAADGNDDGPLAALAARFRGLKRRATSSRARVALRERGQVLKAELARLAAADSAQVEAIEGAIHILGGTKGSPSSFIPLHRLLERQHYRLAYWRVAADEINYRRFFDINELASIRMERPEVFEATHRLILRLLSEGKIQGLRIDHVDGLFDPLAYCRRLRDRAREATGGAMTPYMLVEKILAQHESIRSDWPIDGTTGYETLNLINGLFVDGRAKRAFDRIHSRFIGRILDFEDVVYECKKHVMDTLLAGELEVLAVELDHISEGNWRTRDFTLARLKAALREVIACFPVYRTYVSERGAESDDRRDIDWAVAVARRREQSREATIFDLVHDVLTTDAASPGRRPFNRRAITTLAMKFQQLTGPVTAKALEDTTFYRYTRLLSLNEVGNDPRQFGTTVSAFHHLTLQRARSWPHAMVTTATHDTKRGEDLRARLNALTEFPAEWGRRLRRWNRLNRRFKAEVEMTPCPTAGDEYLLYQTLVGAWPFALLGPADPETVALAAFEARIAAYMVKAVREAKLVSSWASPNAAYEAALSTFIRQILTPERSQAFLADLREFSRRLALPGAVNALAQTVLKFTIPGVPDLYQGRETWDLALVDPDNRRPVDFAARAATLAEMRDLFAARKTSAGAARIAALLDTWTDGRIKFFISAALLGLRRARPDLFSRGEYAPLAAAGAAADHLVAFARTTEAEALIVAVPRLVAGLGAGEGNMPIGDAWADTAITCPPALANRDWQNTLTGETIAVRNAGNIPAWQARELFAILPVATLHAGPA